MNRTITIGACWDGRDFYSAEYVNRLYRACLRNTTIPFDFVLYIGPSAEGRRHEIDPAIRIVQTGLPYWWSGFMFWKNDPPGINTETVLYLDLDQVIVGGLDDLINFPSEQAYMTGYPRHACPPGMERLTCVSTSLLRNGAGRKVWDEYVALGKPQWDPWNPPTGRLLPIGCQSIIDDPAHGMKYDLFPEEWVASYKLQILKKGMPHDCRVVAFHGRPKQHEVPDDFVKEHWI
ncbi:MAG: hypothetical protein WCJ37_01125 [Syntrophus sp. (in: bacteria)]